MSAKVNRRSFIGLSAGATAMVGLGFETGGLLVQGAESQFRTKLKKAVIVEKPTEADFQKLKAAGFDGVEAYPQPEAEAEKCRETAERLGMRVHSVLRGWAEFNSRDTARAEASFRMTEDALKAARAYGADAVLLVPCRIGGMRIPRPWEFQIEFDDKTGHLTRVVYGDNTSYQEYIDAHNHAIDSSREAINRLIPLAEKCGVVIALENVWNNLWVRPAVFRHFVASFKSRWVKAYFDIGNHVKYERPEEWILSLGDLLVKCHVKDFKLNQSDPKGEGEFVNIRDGSVRWPVVRAALEVVGYNGWMTIEGGNLGLEEHSRRLDAIIAGV
ncbi:MAG: sugar phosphate isomerase/epimerase [Verrucomicrobiae bacterium]|nr:sugar phosphate isomerase/epimerase [Verrucomicrobiae bacterium]